LSAATWLPRYGSGALADVLPSVLAQQTGRPTDDVVGLPAATSYVVFLIDGLGWRLLLEHADAAPYLSSLATGPPITCGVPSTTATSLTSLGTGLPPGMHGVVGFTSRIPGTNRLLDALRWDRSVDPREWQRHATVFDAARAAGLDWSVVSKRQFEGSGLTVASQRGASYRGADSLGERVAMAVEACRDPGSLAYVYEGDLDATGHRQGCRSAAWDRELAAIDWFAQELREALPDGVVLVVTADHGMVDVPLARRIDVDLEPDLLDGVPLFGGEARFRHLYCAGGAVAGVAARWRDRLGDEALVVTREEATDSGWFGPVEAHVRPRIGDVMVASMADTAIVSSRAFPREAALVGLHGSLTEDEMLVPLLVDTGG